MGQMKEITSLGKMDTDTWNRVRPQLDDLMAKFGEMKTEIDSFKKAGARGGPLQALGGGMGMGTLASAVSVGGTASQARRASLMATAKGGSMARNPLQGGGLGRASSRRSFGPKGSVSGGLGGGRRASSRLMASASGKQLVPTTEIIDTEGDGVSDVTKMEGSIGMAAASVEQDATATLASAQPADAGDDKSASEIALIGAAE